MWEGVSAVVHHEEDTMRKFIVPVVALAGAIATAGAFAQDTPPRGGMMQMQQGQQGGMGCPMMQRMAAMDARLKQLEERAGIPAPPAQPDTPATPR
jgi:hypothetical protein